MTQMKFFHQNNQNSNQENESESQASDEERIINQNNQIENPIQSNDTNSEHSSQYSLNNDDDNEDLGTFGTGSQQSRWVSCREFYANKLMRFEDSHLHYFGKLYQQYIVDSHIKIENQKLTFLEHNQDKLRVEMYRGLVDAMTAGDTDLAHTGQTLVLPSTVYILFFTMEHFQRFR